MATGLVGTLAIGLGGEGARGLGATLAEALASSARPVAVRAGADCVGSGTPVAGDLRTASDGGFSARPGEKASGSPEGGAIAGSAVTDGVSATVGLSLS